MSMLWRHRKKEGSLLNDQVAAPALAQIHEPPAHVEPKTEPKPEPKPEPKVEPKKAEPKAEPKPEPKKAE